MSKVNYVFGFVVWAGKQFMASHSKMIEKQATPAKCAEAPEIERTRNLFIKKNSQGGGVKAYFMGFKKTP